MFTPVVELGTKTRSSPLAPKAAPSDARARDSRSAEQRPRKATGLRSISSCHRCWASKTSLGQAPKEPWFKKTSSGSSRKRWRMNQFTTAVHGRGDPQTGRTEGAHGRVAHSSFRTQPMLCLQRIGIGRARDPGIRVHRDHIGVRHRVAVLSARLPDGRARCCRSALADSAGRTDKRHRRGAGQDFSLRAKPRPQETAWSADDGSGFAAGQVCGCIALRCFQETASSPDTKASA